MAAKFLILIAVCFLACQAEDFTIQNVGDGLFLTNLDPRNELCRSMSTITTEVANSNVTKQTWDVLFYGSFLGYVLINDAGHMNNVTYEDGGCFPVYNTWNITEESEGVPVNGPTMIRRNWDGFCLTSEGVGNGLAVTECNESFKSQFWNINLLPPV